MKKLLASLMTATLLMPTVALASGPRRMLTPLPNSTKGDFKCLNGEEEFKEDCKITVDETGVIGPEGHITNVVQWNVDGEKYDLGAGIVGGAVGGAVGMGVGMASCYVVLPLCLVTMPMITGAGMGLGGRAGGNLNKFFVVIGEDVNGNKLIQEFKSHNTGLTRRITRRLFKTTGLAAGQLKG